MRRALSAAVVAAALLTGCGGGGNDGKSTQGAASPTQTEVIRSVPTRDGKFDPEAIYKAFAPGVVTIYSLSGGQSGNPLGSGRQGASLGSGFVIDGSGDIATNAHVVTSDSGVEAKAVYVQFGDGNRVEGKIVGTDPNSDVALLRIKPSDLRGAGAKLVPVPFGSTSGLLVGDPVAAIGSPFGEQQSLSTGVVSALNRDIESLTRFPISNAIQTDAAINHGNSGGPLLNAKGRVIGINSQIRSTGGGGEGVGFAIPVETVKRSLDQLRAKGRVDYAYVGISSVGLWPQLAERLGLKAEKGALVDEVQPGSPAKKAGLRGARSHITFAGQPGIPVGGDLIVAVDGAKLDAATDLSDVIGRHAPGDTVSMQIVRGGKKRSVRVTLTARPSGKRG
jgi:S1-C subfamily serine protease